MNEGNRVQVFEAEAAMPPAGVSYEGTEQRQAEASEASFVERRRRQRYPVNAWAEVMVKDGTVLFRGRVLDISALGCFVGTQARLRLAPGTPVEMTFRLDVRTLRCDASCRTVRHAGAGFLFEAMDARTRQEIDALIAEFEPAS